MGEPALDPSLQYYPPYTQQQFAPQVSQVPYVQQNIQSFQGSDALEQSPEMKQYEEQMRQYQLQLKQYEDYQRSQQQQSAQPGFAQASQPQRTPEEILYEQQMAEYQKQKAEYDAYEQSKQEWGYPSAQATNNSYPASYGVSNFGVQGTGVATPVYGSTNFQPASAHHYAAPSQGFAGPPAAHGYAGAPAAHGYAGVPVAHGFSGAPAAHGFAGIPAAHTRSVSLPSSQLQLMFLKKYEIENGARVRLSIHSPSNSAAEFVVTIMSGTLGSLDIATGLIDKLVRKGSIEAVRMNGWRGDQRDVRSGMGAPIAGAVGAGKDTRDRCRDFYSSGACGRGTRCIFRHEAGPPKIASTNWAGVPAVRPGPGSFPPVAGASPIEAQKRMREPGTDDAVQGARLGPYSDVRSFVGGPPDSRFYPRFTLNQGPAQGVTTSAEGVPTSAEGVSSTESVSTSAGTTALADGAATSTDGATPSVGESSSVLPTATESTNTDSDSSATTSPVLNEKSSITENTPEALSSISTADNLPAVENLSSSQVDQAASEDSIKARTSEEPHSILTQGNDSASVNERTDKKKD